MPRPDMIELPSSAKRGGYQLDRINAVLDVAEPLLGVDRNVGERGYVREQPDGRIYVSRNPLDYLYHAPGHPRAGQPRYRWADGPDGAKLGYLVDDAAIAPAYEPPDPE